MHARASWIRDKGWTVFSLWSSRFPGLEVDLFVSEPFDFNETYARAVSVPLDNTNATVISLVDLLTLKQQAARPIHLADFEALRSLAREEEG